MARMLCGNHLKCQRFMKRRFSRGGNKNCTSDSSKTITLPCIYLWFYFTCQSSELPVWTRWRHADRKQSCPVSLPLAMCCRCFLNQLTPSLLAWFLLCKRLKFKRSNDLIEKWALTYVWKINYELLTIKFFFLKRRP